MWWETLVAAIGGVVALILFLAPMKAVLRARQDRVLGDLNPLPFPALTANCAGWVAYSYITDDVLVLWPNMCGYLLALFYTFSCYGLADAKTRDRQAAILLLFSAVLMVVGAVGTLGDMEYDSLKRLWGFTSNAILIIFYASPLSTCLEVLRTRCSASLNLPLSVMNVINGTLWVIYGIAIKDLFLAVPNGIGAVLGLVYCALLLTFPRKSSAKRSPSTSDIDTMSSSRRELMGTTGSMEQDQPGADGLAKEPGAAAAAAAAVSARATGVISEAV
ncbi:hypothetical protein ABPG75_007697 [Micractinium tetrahymenae]